MTLNINQRLNGLNPLAYLGENAVQPPDFVTKNRPPTINDASNAALGDIWLNLAGYPKVLPTAENIYMLVALVGNRATWVNLAGGNALETLTGNSGDSISGDVNDNINIIGAGVISVSGNPGTSTLTIIPSGAIASSFPTDSVTATPTAGVLNVLGGTAGRDINTSGSGNTIHIDLKNAITLGDLSILTAGNPALTLTSGDITIFGTGINAAGNINMPDTTSDGRQGCINFAGTRFIHDFDSSTSSGKFGGSTFVGKNAGSLSIVQGALLGSRNTGIGAGALSSMTTAAGCTAVGYLSQNLNQISNSNCSFGIQALQNLTGLLAANGGSSNIAIGFGAMVAADTTQYCTAVGAQILAALVFPGGNNTCFGSYALNNLTTGSFNIAIGGTNSILNPAATGGSGTNYTGNESSNIVIGNSGVLGESNVLRLGTTGTGIGQQNKCFIAGIRGITTVAADAIPVLISSTGQLGTVSSSARFKENIETMSTESAFLYKLRPVTFDFKNHSSIFKSVGLIAEEVEKVAPALVAHDEFGIPESVKYQDLPVLLLNELQKLNKRLQHTDMRIDELTTRIEILESRL